MTFIVASVNNGGYQPCGSIKDFFYYRGPECLLSGPAETGKTLGWLQKMDLLLWSFPKSRALITRKVAATLSTSVLVTYEDKVLGSYDKEENKFKYGLRYSPIQKIGGHNHAPEYYYPNGSVIITGGMDNPSKILSTEYDFIGMNQGEEFRLDDYENLTTRCTGRAAHAPWFQIMGDDNPANDKHWILNRAKDGHLKLFHSTHRDNPTIYDPITGLLTERGRIALDRLSRLSGVRRDRLFLGKWCSAEGAVWPDFDISTHVIPAFDIPDEWRRIRSIDFGYNEPFVCQWWAISPDKVMYLYREIYMSQRTVNRHAKIINKLTGHEKIETTICDHAASDRADLSENGIYNAPANKSVSIGLQRVLERMQLDKNGKPRIYIFENALVEKDRLLLEHGKPTCTVEEVPNYRYKKTLDGYSKDEPIKEDDHGCDPMRYAVMYVDNYDAGPSTDARWADKHQSEDDSVKQLDDDFYAKEF